LFVLGISRGVNANNKNIVINVTRTTRGIINFLIGHRIGVHYYIFPLS